MSLAHLTIRELRDKLLDGECTALQATEACLERIAQVEDSVRAFIVVTNDRALDEARAADEVLRRRGAEAPLLTGIPLAIKDLIAVEGVPCTCGSKILSNFVPPYDATVIERLKAAGAVVLGKLNMDEFAMGSSTETSYSGPTHNPWDLTKIPGGSSGGSAAAVAADECIAALGSDTGGSVRQPASYCGVVGLKPTYGRVSRYGLVAYASSLDQIGPVTKDVADCATLMNLIAGHDPLDSTSATVEAPDFSESLVEDVEGITIGMPREYFIDGVDPEVDAAVREAVGQLESWGARVEEISLPHTEYAVACYYIIAPAEASSNLARYDGVKYGHRAEEPADLMEMYCRTRAEGFGEEVKRRIMLGTYALSAGYYEAYYRKAQQVRTLIRADFDEAFERVDLIATPVAPTAAFGLGEKLGDPLQMYLSDIFTISVNLAGVPGLSIPCGFSSSGLPIGLQLIGRPFDEATLFRAAYTFEQRTDHHKKKPSLG
ncbi:MAG: Asp-tRNA(Asn)/Glu-tRNA(Gln) amidotransferase subunit GatA [Nitrospinae bacterium]|nr:Asp-tRNA(Asn)/Glu-tRNA(Gln) amidotransferase subunit GatA [Nitrospinota bacterium]